MGLARLISIWYNVRRPCLEDIPAILCGWSNRTNPRFPRDLENERRRAATFQFIPLPVRSSHIGSDLVEM